MRLKMEVLQIGTKEGFLYPFFVSERDNKGKIKLSKIQTVMHGFSIISDMSMSSRFFDPENTDVGKSDMVYEIRVRNYGGEWQDWQAIVGDITLLSQIDFDFAGDADDPFAGLTEKFKENFEIRYSGMLWRNGSTTAQIINEEDELIKEVDFSTFKVKYFSQIDNPCYPLENQIEDMIAFRKKYYVFDEDEKRI